MKKLWLITWSAYCNILIIIGITLKYCVQGRKKSRLPLFSSGLLITTFGWYDHEIRVNLLFFPSQFVYRCNIKAIGLIWMVSWNYQPTWDFEGTLEEIVTSTNTTPDSLDRLWFKWSNLSSNQLMYHMHLSRYTKAMKMLSIA